MKVVIAILYALVASRAASSFCAGGVKHLRGPASDFEAAWQPLRPSRTPIGIKWDYKGSTSDLGDLGPSVVGFPIVILHYGHVMIMGLK